MTQTTVLERTDAQPASDGPAVSENRPAAKYGREQALGAMLFAARRMQLDVTDRQVVLLLDVAERHLLPPDDFPHGTARGYKRHRRRDEPACDSCREAYRLAAAERRKRAGRREPKPCGTEAAYHRHVRRWETACDPCRQAHRNAQRERRKMAAA
ncbi:hypothetical protein [Streptomyces yangpuensis]|uniref:hypothetical protein n=1 Tax=Streptomyces yangpuensis TaxID=1648182 RepID=UPI00364E1038